MGARLRLHPDIASGFIASAAAAELLRYLRALRFCFFAFSFSPRLRVSAVNYSAFHACFRLV